MDKIIKKAENLRIECKDYLIKHLDDLQFANVDIHYVNYTLKVGEKIYPVKIWTANGEDSACFYEEGTFLLNLEYDDYTEEERKKLWEKTQADKNQNGEKRSIKMSQLSKDLYFSFEGVFDKVKFSGYNDNDWWTKHKPTEIKETDEITWQIDLEKMVAIYKKKSN